MARLFGGSDKITEASEIITLLRGDLQSLASDTHPPVTLGNVEYLLSINDAQEISSDSETQEGDIVYMHASSGWYPLVIGGEGEYLRVSAAGIPEWTAAGDVVAHDILSASHGDTAAAAVSRGSIIYGDSTPDWNELTKGALSTHLEAGANDISWVSSLTLADGEWIGLGAAAARVEFSSDGNAVKLYSAADLIVYSDAGSTAVASIDGATGNIATAGTVDGVDVANFNAAQFVTLAATAYAANEQVLESYAPTWTAVHTFNNNIVLANNVTVGQAAGPLLTFDNTNNFLEFSGGYVGIGETTPTAPLHVTKASGAPACVLEAQTNGELATPDGETLRVGHWDGSTTFTERFQVSIAGDLVLATGTDIQVADTAWIGRSSSTERITFLDTTNVIQVNGAQLHITGAGTPGAGSGMELEWDGTKGDILVYNRTTPGYLPLAIRASLITLIEETAVMLRINAGGVTIGADTDAGSLMEWNFSTADLEFVDSGTAAATNDGWIQIEIGGATHYIRTFTSK